MAQERKKRQMDRKRGLAGIWILCLLMFWSTSAIGAEQSSSKDEVSLLWQQGQEQLKAYHFKEAEAFFKKALEKQPSHCPSFMGLLHTYLLLEDLRGVHGLMDQFSGSLQDCTDTDKNYLEAIRAEMQRNWNGALDQYEVIAKRDPTDPKAPTYAALVYLGLKQYTSGIEACQQALKADPKFFLTHSVLGRIARSQGNIVGARS